MSLGIQNNYYSESSMVSAIRKQEAGNVKETFTKQLYFNEVDKAQETKVMTPEEEMEVFKKEFYAELERIPKNRTITNFDTYNSLTPNWYYKVLR